jgi:hypothetical protein
MNIGMRKGRFLLEVEEIDWEERKMKMGIGEYSIRYK